MAIRSKNLNLVPILQSLLTEESVARAAIQVGLSQSAVSGALARLRELLNDPLLVRVGNSMRLTPRAVRMRDRLDEVCSKIEFLFQPEGFDPSRANLSFRIAVPDHIGFLLTEKLLERLATEAPGVRVDFVDVPVDLPNWMENLSIDLAVCGDFEIWPELRKEFLFREHYVAAVAAGHPLLALERVTSKDLLKYPIPGINYDSSRVPNVRNLQITPAFASVAAIVLNSQIGSSELTSLILATRVPMVARVSVLLAQRMQPLLKLEIIEIADEVTTFNTAMFWTEVTDEAVEHRWLRNTVRECLVGPGGVIA